MWRVDCQNSMADGHRVTVGSLFEALARLSLGGMALGGLIGVVTVAALNRITHDKTSELAVTILAAYSAFTLAEVLPTNYAFSGVLSLVALGLVLASTEAKASLSTISFVEKFWHTAEYLANTYVVDP